jgi:hypothetical protein
MSRPLCRYRQGRCPFIDGGRVCSAARSHRYSRDTDVPGGASSAPNRLGTLHQAPPSRHANPDTFQQAHGRHDTGFSVSFVVLGFQPGRSEPGTSRHRASSRRRIPRGDSSGTSAKRHESLPNSKWPHPKHRQVEQCRQTPRHRRRFGAAGGDHIGTVVEAACGRSHCDDLGDDHSGDMAFMPSWAPFIDLPHSYFEQTQSMSSAAS